MADQCSAACTDSIEQMAGHVFLAKMGKKMLRPGGREATNELFDLAQLKSGERVCEIATNRANTAIEMARRFGVRVDGVDVDQGFLATAEQNIAAHGLAGAINVHLGDGKVLPFKQNTFDAVVAEAVITMLPPQQKRDTLKEAARVLKSGGRLLFHELTYVEDVPGFRRQDLATAIRHAAWPVTLGEWKEMVQDAGLTQAGVRTGPMSLMSARGLVRDEGIGGVARIAWSVWRTPGAKKRFKQMAGFFWQHRAALRYIVIRADKTP